MIGPAGDLIEKFRSVTGTSADVRAYRAPGRATLLGDHVESHNGIVVSVATNQSFYITASPNTVQAIRFFSDDFPPADPMPISNLGSFQARHAWTDIPLGLSAILYREGIVTQGFDLLIHSSMPPAGFGSSASLSIGTAMALMGDHHIEAKRLADMCLQVQLEFGYTNATLADLYTCLFGREDGAVRIDFLTGEVDQFPLPRQMSLVAVDSGIWPTTARELMQHRRRECLAVLQIIREQFPQVASLREVTPDMLTNAAPVAPLKRARYVIGENMRTSAFVQASRLGNAVLMGEYITQSHKSLQRDFETTCDEADYLVNSALELTGTFGARLTGPGPGGWTINLVRQDAAHEFRNRIREVFRYRFGVLPQVIICEPSNGASRIS